MKESERDSVCLRLIKEGGKGYRPDKESAFMNSELKEVLSRAFRNNRGVSILIYLMEHYEFDAWAAAERVYTNKHPDFDVYCASRALSLKNEGIELSFAALMGDLVKSESECFISEIVDFMEGMTEQKNLKAIGLFTKMKTSDLMNQMDIPLDMMGEYEIPSDAIVLLDGDENSILFVMDEVRLLN